MDLMPMPMPMPMATEMAEMEMGEMVAGEMVAGEMVVVEAVEAVVQCKHKIPQKCGFLATFFWLTINSPFAIILV
jgi:hypothetical protein